MLKKCSEECSSDLVVHNILYTMIVYSKYSEVVISWAPQSLGLRHIRRNFGSCSLCEFKNFLLAE